MRAGRKRIPAYPGPPGDVEPLMRPLVGEALWFEYVAFLREQEREADGLAGLLSDVERRRGGVR